MKLVYIASPYSGDIEGNTEKARTYCRFAVKHGANVYCPHLLLPQFMSETNPDERRLAIRMGTKMMRKCDELWCFCDQPSAGMLEEMEYAKNLGLPIRQFPAMLETIELKEEEDLCISTPQI